MAKNQNDSFPEFVLDQLGQLDGAVCRRMFGGHGLCRGETFFGILFRGRLYFKTDAKTRGEYARAGMKPFRPNPGQTLRNYDQVPGDVLEDRNRL